MMLKANKGYSDVIEGIKFGALNHPDTWNVIFDQLLSNDVYMLSSLGRYFVTPLVGNLSCEFRLDFPIRSVKFGYYALAIDGKAYTDAVPVNQPIRTASMLFDDLDSLTVVFYDLRDIITDENGVFVGMGWESLLNQKWFDVQQHCPVSLELAISKISMLGDVQYGTLMKFERNEDVE